MLPTTTFSQIPALILLLLFTQMSHASPPLSLLTQSSSPATCRGSFWCPKFNTPSNRINLYLQNWINYTMSDADVYGPGVQIACATVTILFPPLGTNAYCAFTRGTESGINGSVIKRRMEDLRSQGCFACGYVSVEEESGDEGVLVVDYVSGKRVRCGREGDVVCPPTVPGGGEGSGGEGDGERPALRVFNATVDDGAVMLQALNVQEH